MKFFFLSLMALTLLFPIYQMQASAKDPATTSGGLVGYALNQNERQRLQNGSPETLNRIDTNAPLSASDILRMATNGVSDDNIIGAIDTTSSVYHLTPADISELQNAGVSQQVIDYMIQTGK